MEVMDPSRKLEDFPPKLDKDEFNKKLSSVHKAKDTPNKGKSLEDLVEFLLKSTAIDMSIERNVRTLIGEIDLVVNPKSYFHRPRGKIAVECKNWSRKVGPKDIAWFILKIVNHGFDCGLVFAQKGITGKDLSGAQGVISLAKNKLGIDILIITNDDLQRILDCMEFDCLLSEKENQINKLPDQR